MQYVEHILSFSDSARSLSGGAKGNPLPGDMSKTAKVAAEHVKYNIPNQEPINCHGKAVNENL